LAALLFDQVCVFDASLSLSLSLLLSTCIIKK